MDEIDAIKTIADSLEKLEVDARARVLAWALAKYGTGAATIQTAAQASPISPTPSSDPSSSAAVGTGALSKGKTSKKTKTIISMDKNLNLSPQGKQSAVQFAAVKAPTNVREKCVVATYYLRDIIEAPKVTAQGVFTFFKTVQWPVPTDMKNTLQQAGSAGWLDTADSDDIKLTSLGENLVEHNLPAKLKQNA